MPVPQKKLVPTEGWKIETDLKAGKKRTIRKRLPNRKDTHRIQQISQGDFYL
jgi:hypothetical protein